MFLSGNSTKRKSHSYVPKKSSLLQKTTTKHKLSLVRSKVIACTNKINEAWNKDKINELRKEFSKGETQVLKDAIKYSSKIVMSPRNLVSASILSSRSHAKDMGSAGLSLLSDRPPNKRESPCSITETTYYTPNAAHYPLEMFDFEKEQDSHLYDIENEKARFLYYEIDQGPVWRECTVLRYEKELQQFLLEYNLPQRGVQKKYVGRLSLLFPNDIYESIELRRSKSNEIRKIHEAILRYLDDLNSAGNAIKDGINASADMVLRIMQKYSTNAVYRAH